MGHTLHTKGWSFLPVKSGRHPVLLAQENKVGNGREGTGARGGGRIVRLPEFGIMALSSASSDTLIPW